MALLWAILATAWYSKHTTFQLPIDYTAVPSTVWLVYTSDKLVRGHMHYSVVHWRGMKYHAEGPFLQFQADGKIATEINNASPSLKVGPADIAMLTKCCSKTTQALDKPLKVTSSGSFAVQSHATEPQSFIRPTGTVPLVQHSNNSLCLQLEAMVWTPNSEYFYHWKKLFIWATPFGVALLEDVQLSVGGRLYAITTWGKLDTWLTARWRKACNTRYIVHTRWMMYVQSRTTGCTGIIGIKTHTQNFSVLQDRSQLDGIARDILRS